MLNARPQACRGEPAAAVHEIFCPWVLAKSRLSKMLVCVTLGFDANSDGSLSPTGITKQDVEEVMKSQEPAQIAQCSRRPLFACRRFSTAR
jgi:hypothetical protein